MTNLQQQIRITIEKIVHIDKVDNQLATTQQELDDALADHEELTKKINKELRDVEKIEGLSTKSIFYKILGSREKQIEKERQEYLEISLQYEDTQKSIELLEYEVNLLAAKVKSKDGLVSQLEQLKLRREEEIIKYDAPLRNKLLHLSNQLEQGYILSKEIEEAKEVAAICHNLLNQIISQLSKVRNWGQWPQQRGRMNNMHRRAQHRQAIDRARNLSYQIKHHINLLDQELRDLGKQLTLNLNPDNLANFSSFFFNNLITDWIMNQQLTQALGSASQARDHIKEVIYQLDHELEESTTTIHRLQQDRDDILMS